MIADTLYSMFNIYSLSRLLSVNAVHFPYSPGRAVRTFTSWTTGARRRSVWRTCVQASQIASRSCHPRPPAVLSPDSTLYVHVFCDKAL